MSQSRRMLLPIRILQCGGILVRRGVSERSVSLLSYYRAFAHSFAYSFSYPVADIEGFGR